MPRDHANPRTRDQLILETMTTKSTDFKKIMTAELTGFIQSQARVLSLVDLNQLVINLPALRERFAKIPSETYPYLSDQLEFLCLSCFPTPADLVLPVDGDRTALDGA